MKTSESIKNLAPALLAAQRKIEAVIKDAKNPYFGSTYADLPSVIDATKRQFNDAGVLVMQPPFNRDGKNFIETILVHAASGEWASSETEVVCAKQNDPQAFGAAQTYARRFGLQSFALLPAEDDDGNKASGREAPAKATPKAAVAKSTPAVSTTPAIAKTTDSTTTAPAVGNVAETTTTATTAAPTTPRGVRSSTFRNKANGAAPSTTAAPVASEVAKDGWSN